jgi:asparagine synthase (glutamine-hydrolysing)
LGNTLKSAVGKRTGVASAGHDCDIYHQNGLLIAACGKARLTVRTPEAEPGEGLAHSIALGYRRYGEEVLRFLSGAFAVAIANERTNEAVLAIDRMGIFSLSYTIVGECLVFGSTADAINLHSLVQPEINLQAIYNYVFFHMVPSPGTIYTGQHRLLPGTYLLFPNGKPVVKNYWEMRYQEGEERPVSELKQEFVDTLKRSVAEAAERQAVGAFLSGGTDSSTLAGILGQVSGSPARTYSIGFAAEGYDEMEYARIAATHFATKHHEYYVSPDDVQDAVPRIAAIYDQPFGNSSAVPAYYCARMAKADGVGRLLAGDGGDELFGGNQRYAKQYVFSVYEQLPSGIRSRLVEPLAFAIPAGDKLPVVRKLVSYVRQASQPMPARLESYNLLHYFGPKRVFTGDFLAAVETAEPLRLLGEVYQAALAQTLINRMLALDLKFTLADNDLPKVVRTCELAGVDVSFPMLNDEVVAFSARLAPHLKLKGTKLRYFFKEALRGFLPDAIIKKKKHGFGLPFGPWLRNHRGLQELADDSLQDLKARGIVRAEFVNELLTIHLANHPEYHGSMIWILMMLEQWFSRHSAASITRPRQKDR